MDSVLTQMMVLTKTLGISRSDFMKMALWERRNLLGKIMKVHEDKERG